MFYPDKFHLITKVEEADNNGIYYIATDLDHEAHKGVMRQGIESWLKDIYKEKNPVPAGQGLSIDIQPFLKYIPKDLKYHILLTSFSYLREPEAKLDYYYSMNINPLKVVLFSACNYHITPWGIKGQVDFIDDTEYLTIADIAILTNIASCFVGEKRLPDVIGELVVKGFLYKEPVTEEIKDGLTFHFRSDHSNSNSISLSYEGWKDLFYKLKESFFLQE